MQNRNFDIANVLLNHNHNTGVAGILYCSYKGNRLGVVALTKSDVADAAAKNRFEICFLQGDTEEAL